MKQQLDPCVFRYLVGFKASGLELSQLASTKIFSDLTAAIKTGLAKLYQEDLIDLDDYEILLQYSIQDWTVSLLNRWGIVLVILDDDQLKTLQANGESLITQAPYIVYLPVLYDLPASNDVHNALRSNYFQLLNSAGWLLSLTFNKALYRSYTQTFFVPSRNLTEFDFNTQTINQYLNIFLGAGGNLLELPQREYRQVVKQIT